MAFGPNSQVVAPAQFIPEIDPNLLLKGSQFQEMNTERDLKESADSLSSIMGIPSWGKDREKLNNINNTLQEQIKGLSTANLNNPATLSTIKGLIKSTANSPDVQAIASRGFQFQQMQQENREAIKAGKNYINPGYEDAQRYYSGSDYIRDKGFTNNGFIGVDMAKRRAEFLKEVPMEKKQVMGSDGFFHETKSYAPKALEQALHGFYSDPEISREIQYNLDKKYQDVDWEQESSKHLDQFKSAAKDNYNKAYQLQQGFQQGTSEYQQYGQLVDKYQKELGNFDKMSADTKGHAEQYKRSVFAEDVNNQIQTDVANSQFYSEEGQKANDFALDGQKFSHELSSQQLKPISEGLNALGITAQQAMGNKALLQQAQTKQNEIDVETGSKKKEPKTDEQKADASVSLSLTKYSRGERGTGIEQNIAGVINNNKNKLGLREDTDISPTDISSRNNRIVIKQGRNYVELSPEQITSVLQGKESVITRHPAKSKPSFTKEEYKKNGWTDEKIEEAKSKGLIEVK